MPNIIVLKGYHRLSDWAFTVTESTPWEAISKEELEYLRRNLGNSFTILEQVTAVEATLSAKALLEEAERQAKEREETIKLAEEKENKRREWEKEKRKLEKEKRKQREIARAKKLLAEESISRE